MSTKAHLDRALGQPVALSEFDADILCAGCRRRREEHPGYPATVTRRTRGSEAAVTIFPADGQASWPSPLRDSRRDPFPVLPPARAPQAWVRTWARLSARISVLASARISVQRAP